MTVEELDLIILKTLISNKKHAVEFVNDYDSKLFLPNVWNVANSIINYIKAYKDIPTLNVILDKLNNKNEALRDNHINIWNQIEATNINDHEYKHYLEKIKNRYAASQIFDLKQSFNAFDGNNNIPLFVSKMNKTLQSIKRLNQVKAYDRKTLKEVLPLFKEEYRAKVSDPTFDRGMKTGYSMLDYLTDGLRDGELLLIGAETGSGKSMLLMNIAIQMWMQQNSMDMTSNWIEGHNVLYYTLEMPFKPCLNRLLARLAQVPSRKIRNATLNNEEIERLKKALRFIKNYPYEFEIVDIPRGATMEGLELIYEDVKINHDPKIIVIDYLSLMSYKETNLDDWIKLGKIAEQMHEFARANNSIVLSAVQLNRVKPSKNSEENIGLHRVGRSSLILQNANVAIQIETRQNEKDYIDMIYHILKNRDGALDKGRLIKNLPCGILVDDDEISVDNNEHLISNSDDISDKIDLLNF